MGSLVARWASVAAGSYDTHALITSGPSPSDTDGDRLSDAVETNTGVFVSSTDTGTDPNRADTDGDAINDGDETVGTPDGLDLPTMGTSPLKKNLLLEFDWFDDSNNSRRDHDPVPGPCGAHSHRPTAAQITAYTTAFANANTANPDGTTGVKVISDYGQGGAFTGGNLIADADGVIVGTVEGADFTSKKAANFAANRNGYFHYVLMPHLYDAAPFSSGYAEINGDDLVVSLQCTLTTTYVANTIMHELGHNLGLRHAGNVDLPNFKPNYNSVMNYKYQFAGVDNNCTPDGDGVLSYSYGTRIALNENNLDESKGICGSPAFDWNGSGTITNPVVADINLGKCGFCPPSDLVGDGLFQVLTDYNDWTHLFFGGLADPDGSSGAGRPLRPVEVIVDTQ